MIDERYAAGLFDGEGCCRIRKIRTTGQVSAISRRLFLSCLGAVFAEALIVRTAAERMPVPRREITYRFAWPQTLDTARFVAALDRHGQRVAG